MLQRAGRIVHLIAIAVTGLLCACGKPGPAPAGSARSCFLTTADGVRLAATFYPVSATSPPSLVLVHMAGADRRAWEPFALKAQRAGYACLAFDLRGHGESVHKGDATISYRNFKTADWLAAANDIDAARQYLIDQSADPHNCALAGASIGANLALRYALDHPDVPAIVLVSPGLDYKGVTIGDAIAAYGDRPSLLMTAEGDSYSASSCTTLKRAASGLCELREYAGAAHGTALFDVSVSAVEQVFLWLAPIVGPPAAPHVVQCPPIRSPQCLTMTKVHRRI